MSSILPGFIMRTIATLLLGAAVASALSVSPAAADSDDIIAGAIAGAAAGAWAGSVFAAPPPQVYVYGPYPGWTRPVPQPPPIGIYHPDFHRDGWDEDFDEEPGDDGDWGH